MPTIGWFEILIVVAIAIIVLGPKDFPIMLKKVGSWIGTAKKYIKNDSSTEVKVGPSESMSKSKKNTIDPGKMVAAYGADAVRFFILSDSPPEKDIQWSDEGMKSSYKFIQKFF